MMKVALFCNEYIKVEQTNYLKEQIINYAEKFQIGYNKINISIIYCRDNESNPFEMFKLNTSSHSKKRQLDSLEIGIRIYIRKIY